MPFDSESAKKFRFLFYPVSLLAGLYIFIRNKLYDWKWLKPVSFNFPIICVGNLSVGGTGKSPMIELLIGWLKPHMLPATLSRGYKRKTEGYLIAGPQVTALEIGDEPMQFYIKHPEIPVAVGESRVHAIPLLLHDAPETGVILLDDAFQHRKIKAGLNIVLTAYENPFWDDHYLPAGELRDSKSSVSRADIIVVTKCPGKLTAEEAEKFRNEIQAYAPETPVYFTTLNYGEPYQLYTNTPKPLQADETILLVTGIANPRPLMSFLGSRVKELTELSFPDHHIFDIDDLKKIKAHFSRMPGTQKRILTTEKDSVRLIKFGKELEDLDLFVQPVCHHVLFDQEESFKERIINFAINFRKDKSL